MSELKVASCFEFEKVLRGKSNKLFYPKSEVDAGQKNAVCTITAPCLTAEDADCGKK